MADFITNLADIGEEAIRMLVGAVQDIANGTKKKPAYDAHFISEREILSTKHTGFSVTGRRNLNTKISHQNFYVQAPTGAGKTTCVILPSLYTMTGSFVVHDPSGEIEKMSSGYLKEKGYEVKVINFSRPEISCGFNPFAKSTSATLIHKTAHTLVSSSLGDNAKDPFWNIAATGLVSNMIWGVSFLEEKYRTPYAALQLLNLLSTAPKSVLHFFKTHANDAVWSDFSAFMSGEERVKSSVIATARAALQIFSDAEGVGKITAFDTLNMEDFRKKKCVLYIQTATTDQKFYAVLTALLFDSFFTYVLSRIPEKDDQDIFFLIDEAAFKIPGLPQFVVNGRKYKSGSAIIVQDFNQLVRTYSKQEAEVIRENCYSKLYFPGSGQETTQHLENVLGKTEVTDEDGKKKIMPLLPAASIRTLKSDQAILLCGNVRPILAQLHPFYNNPTYRRYSAMTPVPQMNQIPFTEIPTLSLDTAEDDEA